MSRSRFVTPTVRVLPLPGGDTVTVRDRLTHGEASDGYAFMTAIDPTSGELRTDPRKARDALVLAYLVDWSFADTSGAVVPYRGLPLDERVATIANLDPLDFSELYDAIFAHDRDTRARIVDEKKTAATPVSVPT